jgi:hypothetical protein
MLAGNIFLAEQAGQFFKNGTSETSSNKSVGDYDHVNFISKHVPIHLKPFKDQQFGYYLAGLIDGEGHFSKDQQLVITFSSTDAFLAYYIKERLGYGNVKKVKDKKRYILIVSNKKGILKVLHLIKDKLRIEHRFKQVVNNILNNDMFKDININFIMDLSNDFNNH